MERNCSSFYFVKQGINSPSKRERGDKMKNKILLLIIVLGILSNVVSAFLISDQGTELREVATGNLTRLANLTIEIYDGSVGGNLIFNQSFSNAIANGSWNLMISPGLEYGKSYWKDYKINGEDLDFDG